MKMCSLIRQVEMAIRFAYQIGKAKHARLQVSRRSRGSQLNRYRRSDRHLAEATKL